MTSASPARSSRSGSVCERLGIGEHGRGLMKRADEILAAGMIDAGLAADRRIHLREQRRWHLHERDAALVTGGGEASHVADHAAAQRNDAGIAREAVGDQHVEHARDVRERLVHLAVRQRHFHATPRRERGGELGGVQRPDGRVGDQQDVARGNGPVELGLELHGAGADEDRIAAYSQFYFDSLHAESVVADCADVQSICGLRPFPGPP